MPEPTAERIAYLRAHFMTPNREEIPQLLDMAEACIGLRRIVADTLGTDMLSRFFAETSESRRLANELRTCQIERDERDTELNEQRLINAYMEIGRASCRERV